ncbi:MAG: type II toxin-antitoxin system Phd/YefM family antitoxin [Candidatus Omnitrophota bacterium]
MTTLSATKLRGSLFHVLKKASKAHVPFLVTSRGGDVVIISKVDYENLLESLELLSTPGVLKGVREARADVKAGRTKSMDEVFGS